MPTLCPLPSLSTAAAICCHSANAWVRRRILLFFRNRVDIRLLATICTRHTYYLAELPQPTYPLSTSVSPVSILLYTEC
jgi:hypothetical protein